MSRGTRATLLLLVLLLGAPAGALAAVREQAKILPAYDADGKLVILALGSDIGPPNRPGDPRRGRADAIHLIAVDTRRERATIVDIPRDALIGGTKVNSHLNTGGPDAMVAVLEDYTGVKIDYHVLTSFSGLQRMVGALGGVRVTIDTPMYDRASGSHFDTGPRRLGPKNALAFSRDRHSLSNGDFGRTRNQGELLRAAHRSLQDRNLLELVRLAGAFSQNTVTDIPNSLLLEFALLAMRIHPGDVAQVPLSGAITMGAGGASIVLLNPGDAFADIRADRIGP